MQEFMRERNEGQANGHVSQLGVKQQPTNYGRLDDPKVLSALRREADTIRERASNDTQLQAPISRECVIVPYSGSESVDTDMPTIVAPITEHDLFRDRPA